MNQRMKNLVAAGALVIGAAVFGATLVHAVWYAPDSEIVPPPSLARQVRPVATSTLPARLEIPAIRINATVQRVGITAKGNMGTPSNFTDVAWYKYGTVPGHTGSAVIDGHVDNGLGLNGVFKHLDQVQAGDDIYVLDASGRTLHFVVDRTAEYPYKEVPTNEIFASSSVPNLVLITCGGAWVESDKTYDHRLVVFATLAS